MIIWAPMALAFLPKQFLISADAPAFNGVSNEVFTWVCLTIVYPQMAIPIGNMMINHGILGVSCFQTNQIARMDHLDFLALCTWPNNQSRFPFEMPQKCELQPCNSCQLASQQWKHDSSGKTIEWIRVTYLAIQCLNCGPNLSGSICFSRLTLSTCHCPYQYTYCV